MKKFRSEIFVLSVLLFVLLMGCTSEDAGPVLLQVSGAVEQETGFTEKDLNALGLTDVDFTEKSGDVSTYTGVQVRDVLSEVGVTSDASAVGFVGDDGYEAETTLEEIQTCEDCIVALLDEGGLKMVMPGFSSKLQVKGVIEFRVK